MTRRNVGVALYFATLSACLVLHIAAFLIAVPFLLILVPFGLLAGTILCASPRGGWRNPGTPKGRTAVIGWVLLVYAVMLFVQFYRSSGGASSVEIVDGQYVFMSKNPIIRPITEREYRMFPSHVARIMSAWMGMMAMFCMSSLLRNQSKGRQLTADEVLGE